MTNIFWRGPWGPPLTPSELEGLPELIDQHLEHCNANRWIHDAFTYETVITHYREEEVKRCALLSEATSSKTRDQLNQFLAKVRPERLQPSGKPYKPLRWRSMLPEEQEIKCSYGIAQLVKGEIQINHLLVTPMKSLKNLLVVAGAD